MHWPSIWIPIWKTWDLTLTLTLMSNCMTCSSVSLQVGHSKCTDYQSDVLYVNFASRSNLTLSVLKWSTFQMHWSPIGIKPYMKNPTCDVKDDIGFGCHCCSGRATDYWKTWMLSLALATLFLVYIRHVVIEMIGNGTWLSHNDVHIQFTFIGADLNRLVPRGVGFPC